MTNPVSAPSFPLNAWYAAAWDVDVSRTLAAITICGIRLLLYRRRDRGVVALEDACWHRMLPLSKGRLIGDEVECGYHGLVFNPEGACTHIPGQPQIPKQACVRSFPVIERHRFIWVWPGDPAVADPALVPDLHWNHDPSWSGDGRTIHAKCDYRLVIDNLMDLTHETFVHSGSIGDRAVAEAPFSCTQDERHVTVTRWMLGIEPPPFWANQYGKPGLVDRWQIIRFEAPATVTIDVGVAAAGSHAPAGDRSQGVNAYILNTITPESETTCHYFWAIARNYRRDEQAITTELRDGVTRIFREDEAILEAQQQALAAHPERRMVNLGIDVGGVRARKLIDRMIAAESAVAASTANEIHAAQHAQ
jgi:phenylpropionate dioxygenase-like ring-hydroxylating dioxygenase large terminal subunit